VSAPRKGFNPGILELRLLHNLALPQDPSRLRRLLEFFPPSNRRCPRPTQSLVWLGSTDHLTDRHSTLLDFVFGFGDLLGVWSVSLRHGGGLRMVRPTEGEIGRHGGQSCDSLIRGLLDRWTSNSDSIMQGPF